ncbi:hypothetical protein BH24ACT5_BH24ACT5_06410 [soil metagenome]
MRPRSPLARALLPIVGGVVVMAAIFGVLWATAAWISHGAADSTPTLAPPTFEVGRVESVAESVEKSGPLLFPGLGTTSGERTLVVDHAGDDPARGWRVYWAYPADGQPSCGVTQVRQTAQFTDCEGRQLSVTDLAVPDGVCPVVENRRTLLIDLRRATSDAADSLCPI